MPHWAWVVLAFGLIVGLFGVLPRLGGSEPRDGWHNDGWGYSPGDGDHHGDGGGHH